MRRSSSSSHIPLPRSKSFVRNSKEFVANNAAKPRSSSNERLPPLKRSNSFLSQSRRTATMTPTMQNRPSYVSSTKKSKTPTSLRKKSPMTVKLERHVNDKKWVSEQYAKVRFFLQNHPEVEALPELKPPTINTFVYVTDLLFREIDPRIKITMANYKDLVFTLLKSYSYPGTVSNSMMKTVNTMHTWPHVISIFAWLIDLTEFLNDARLDDHPKWSSKRYQVIECIKEFLAKKYIVFNGNPGYTEKEADDEFAKNFETIMDIDVDKIKRLQNEVAELTNHKEIQASQISKLQSEFSVIQKETDQMQREIDAFENTNPLIEKELLSELENEEELEHSLVKRLAESKENCIKYHKLIAKQPCTYKEKMTIESHIDELKHTVELKRNKIETRRGIKDKFDRELVEKKKRIENEVYRLNSSLMQLTTVDARLKALYLRDMNFVDENFKDEIKNMLESKEKFERNINEKIAEVKSQISEMEIEEVSLDNSIQISTQASEKLEVQKQQIEEKIEQLEEKLDEMFSKAEVHKQEILRKIDDLIKSKHNLHEAMDELEGLLEKKSTMETGLTKLQKNCIEFIIKLNDMSVETVTEMDKILFNVTSKVKQTEESIRKQQAKFIENLHKLDDIKKS